MFELAAEMRKDGQPVYDLSLGNPSLEPPAIWREAVRSLLEDEPKGMHRYMTNAGYPEVRAFIAQRESARYDIAFAPEDVTMTVGAAGGINVLFRAMLDPEDEVVVPAPYFSEYDHYCANAGCTLVPLPSGEDFALDAGSIAQGLSDKTRLILLNSPNNPTGAIYEEADMAALAKVLAAHEEKIGRPIFVVEDSPYRDLVHDGSDVSSMLRHHPNTVFLTSHSKDLGLAGERIGYMLISPDASGREVLRRAFSFANRILGFVNAPALMQRALPLVLGRPEGRVDVSEYARHCQRMAEGLTNLGFHLPPVRAGFFLFPRLPEALASRLEADDPEGGGADVVLTNRLREARCVVVPGTAFGVPGHLRLSMCVDDAAVDGALEAFQRICG